MTSFPAALVGLLSCPVCGASLRLEPPTFRCEQGHTFDLARQGYVHLSARPLREGDTSQMVQARVRFLAAGHYAPLALRLSELAAQAPPGPVLDVGAGTGHYLAQVLDARPSEEGLAVDLSRAAARRAASAHPRLGAIVADAEVALPCRDEAFGLALSVFAPRPREALARVTWPGGHLLVASAGEGHMAELRGELDLLGVGGNKQAQLESRLEGLFERIHQESLRFALRLSREDAADLIGMGPNAFHLTPEALQARVEKLPPELEVTADVDLAIFRRTRTRTRADN